MATKQFSATVNEEVYKHFEQARLQVGTNRSQAVESALKLWLKAWTDDQIAEGCRASREEDLAMAKASKRKILKALSKNL